MKQKQMRLLSVPLFIGAILFAAASALSQDGDRTAAESLNMLLTVRTVECDLLIDTFVDGKEYSARGTYQEQSLPNINRNTFLRSMYRLEIVFPVPILLTKEEKEKGVGPNRMTLVCHPSEDPGKNRLERYIEIEGTKTFSTIDLVKVEEKIRKTEADSGFMPITEVPHLGGLAGTFRQIVRYYEFSAPMQEILPGDEKMPVSKLTGSLRSTYRKELLEHFGGLTKKGQYPPGFPSDIEIFIGRHNDFPYKIRYLRRPSESSEKRELLLQEIFANVKVNETAIPAAKFDPLKVPENVFKVTDDTESILRSL